MILKDRVRSRVTWMPIYTGYNRRDSIAGSFKSTFSSRFTLLLRRSDTLERLLLMLYGAISTVESYTSLQKFVAHTEK